MRKMVRKMWPRLRITVQLVLLMFFTGTSDSVLLKKFEDPRRPGMGNPKMQLVTVDFQTDYVYVGARNVLYELDHNLELKNAQWTGPALDGPTCDPKSDSCDNAELTNNEAAVLEIYPDLAKRFLLFCGTLKQGLCRMYTLNNISQYQILDVNNIVNYMGSQESTVAYFGKVHSLLGEENIAIYTAVSYDLRPPIYSPIAVSARVIKQGTNGLFNISYAFENPSHADGAKFSGIDIDSVHKRSYIVDYIYGFEYDGFSYFLTVQKDGVQVLGNNNYVTRLIRVCQNDPSFYSYTEITMQCGKGTVRGFFYNVAQAAYLGNVGSELAHRFNWDSGEKVLYISFAKSHPHSRVVDDTKGSGICMYTMSEIKRVFVKAQMDCYKGFGELLPWIIHTQPRCTYNGNILMDIDEKFCGRPTNVGIGSRYPLTATANFTSDNHVSTSLGIIIYKHSKTIAIMGTIHGYVVKILLDGYNSRPYVVINVGEGASERAVARDIAFDSNLQHMYALTGNKVTKVPIQSCSVYSECSACVTNKDPLDCGWCGDKCSTRAKCLQAVWSKESCPPIIYSFTPKSGPTKGGTQVTIKGHNFGSSDPTLEGTEVSASVKVALVDCVIEYRNSSTIVCRTGESDRPKEREVKVFVKDRSKHTVPFIIEGPGSTDQDHFIYKIAKMRSFMPTMGPKSGGTSLTIMGDNLDIGSSLHISLGHLPCTPVTVLPSHIICNTSTWQPELNFHKLIRRSIAEETVNITIDAASLFLNGHFFHYKEDPIIVDVFPKSSILSGGMDITVSGENLHVVSQPRIMGTIIGESSHFYQAACQANDDGMLMICQTPNINKTKMTISSELPLVVDIHFLMDGVQELRDFPRTHPTLSRFTYVKDPVFYRFSGSGNIRMFYEDETHLDIKGENLDLVDMSQDIDIMIGDGFCNVTLIGTTVLLCAPDKPKQLNDIEEMREVKIRIGNLFFDLGYLQFSKREPNAVVAGLMGCGLGVLFIIIIIFMIMWMKKTHKGPFKKKLMVNEPDVRYSRGDRVDFGSAYREQTYRLNTSPREENPYWQQSQVRQRPVPPRRANESIFDDEASRLIEDANLLIDRDCILLLDVIGQGHFGCVYRGYMRLEGEKEETEVAVKTLKSLTDHTYTSSLDGRKFLEEALRMREFDHAHILRLKGIALDKENMPLVVLPFMKHGDLLSYIRDEMNSPTVKDLMDFGIQISEGMAYLANLKFVHRDLAARNCMLDDKMNIKVADFGLSRDIYERDYYSSDDRKAKLPVKWMALESLEKGIYNIRTDVWSYGVVLWELMTRGVCPYPEVDNWDIIKYLKSGRRMPQPAYCPDDLYSLMLECWDGDAKLRPTFEECVSSVNQIIVNMERVHEEVGFSATYINVPVSQNYLYPKSSRHSLDGASGIYPKYGIREESQMTMATNGLYPHLSPSDYSHGTRVPAMSYAGVNVEVVDYASSTFPRCLDNGATGGSTAARSEGLYSRPLENGAVGGSSAGLYPRTVITNATSKSTLV